MAPIEPGPAAILGSISARQDYAHIGGLRIRAQLQCKYLPPTSPSCGSLEAISPEVGRQWSVVQEGRENKCQVRSGGSAIPFGGLEGSSESSPGSFPGPGSLFASWANTGTLSCDARGKGRFQIPLHALCSTQRKNLPQPRANGALGMLIFGSETLRSCRTR